jgi:uncharacterized protein (DUF849 family)
MARTPEKVIITCAITGSVHTPTMSPHLPITPNEIAQEAVAAGEAGAAILHLHARDPETGQPTADTKVFDAFLPRIKQATNSVVNITSGHYLGAPMEERLASVEQYAPEMCTFNMEPGTDNFLAALVDRYPKFKFDWEREYLDRPRDADGNLVPNMMESLVERVGDKHGTKFEFECYDVGHLYLLASYLDRGLVKPPLFIQSIFGVGWGTACDPDNLVHVKRIADKLFGDDYYWSVLAAGRHQLAFTTMAAIMGGNVRVGLEDSLYIRKGELAKSNADQVKAIRTILETLSLEVATPDEARSMLGLKGGDNVSF